MDWKGRCPVSHGGAAFPDVEMILQGDGVHVDLTGETFINNTTGVTSVTFPNTPDVPFESMEVTSSGGRSQSSVLSCRRRL